MSLASPATLWQRVLAKLDSKLPDWRGRIDHFGQVAAVQRRRRGGGWSDNEVFEALLRAVLSNATDWSKVEAVLPELRERFSDFDIAWYSTVPLETIEEDFIGWFEKRRADSMTLKAGLVRLRTAAEDVLERSKTAGNVDEYFAGLVKEHRGDPKLAALALGTEGRHKLVGFGVPLAAEALRNLGFDLAKPDRHVNRAMGCFELVEFSSWRDRSGTKAPSAKPKEMYECMAVVERWARAEGVAVSFLDNALWLLCARMSLHLDNAALAALAQRQ